MPHKIVEVEGVAGKTVQENHKSQPISTFAISLSAFPTRIARLKDGDLVKWKKLKAQPATLKIRERND